MSRRWAWLLPWRRPDATIDEARIHLQRLKRADAEIERLGRELRDVQRSNHFSEMVTRAIAKAARGGA